MNTVLNNLTKLAIPAAVGISLAQASLYDVKGGSRAVIFDRLAGVKNEVRLNIQHQHIPFINKADGIHPTL